MSVVGVFEGRNSIIEYVDGEPVSECDFNNGLVVRLHAAKNSFLCQDKDDRFWSDNGNFSLFVICNLEIDKDGEYDFDLGLVVFDSKCFEEEGG